jgi:hypothetical protein
MSLEAYRRGLTSQSGIISAQLESARTATPDTTFTVGGTTKSQTEVISELETIQGNIQSEIGKTYEFEPSTTVSIVPGGFQYNFPYAGAEKYYEYKKLLQEHPGQAAALGWGWGGLGNVDIAIYRATGHEEKALQRQIEQLSGYAGAKKALASGDILGFSGQYWGGYLSSPATQMAISYGIGEAFGGVGSYLGGRALIASSPALISTGKVISYGVGGAFIGWGAKGVVESVQSGDIGKAVGQTWMLGTNVASGIAGYQAGATYVTKTGLTWEERGGQAGALRYAKKMEIASKKFGGQSVAELEGTRIVNPTWADKQSWFNQRTIAQNFGIKPRDLPSWKDLSFSPERAALYKAQALGYYENLASLRSVSSLAFQKGLIASQGGWKSTFSNILGSELKGAKAYEYLTNATSGFGRRLKGFLFRTNQPELMGGVVSKYYPKGTGTDIDVNTAYGRYIMDMLQLQKYHPELFGKFDIKPHFKTGQVIATTGYRQPAPYDIFGMKAAPLIKTAATTGEVGFGLPAEEGIKSLSSAANYFTRLAYIQTGKIPSITSAQGRYTSIIAQLEKNPFIQSSARITYLFEHKTIGQKLLPYISKIYAKVPSDITAGFYKMNIGFTPSSIGRAPSFGYAFPSSFIGSPISMKSVSSASSTLRSISSSLSSASKSISRSISSSSVASSKALSSGMSSSLSSLSSSLGVSSSLLSSSISSSISSYSSSSSSSSSSSASSKFSSSMLASPSLSASFQGGDYGFAFGEWGKRKRFRKAKTIDPFNEFRKQMGTVDFGI